MSTAKTALIIGATGATGRHLLRELLASSQYTRVGEYGRRVTPQEQLADITGAKDKLEQKTIDFDKLSDAESEQSKQLREGKWDVLYITLGTTRSQAGSAAAFEKIDREYVVNAAKAVKTAEPGHEQRLVYLSSTGADATSMFLYPKSKGLTENALASLGYSDTIVFRPGFLDNAHRSQSRIMESMAGAFVGLASRFSSQVAIDVGVLAKSVRMAGEVGSKGLPATAKASIARAGSAPDAPQFTIIDNAGALGMSKTA